MSRFRLIAGTVSVVLIGCVVAALVQAQDATRLWSAAKGVRSSGSYGGPELVDQYKSAGQSIASAYAASVSNGTTVTNGQPPVGLTAHHDPATMLASDEAPSSGSLRSVLKKNAAPASAPAAVPEPVAPPPEPTLPESPPTDSRPQPKAADIPPVTPEAATESSLIGPPSSAAALHRPHLHRPHRRRPTRTIRWRREFRPGAPSVLTFPRPAPRTWLPSRFPRNGSKRHRRRALRLRPRWTPL